MTLFRPCIDLYQGKVAQIVGGSLSEEGARTNFVSQADASDYAALYRDKGLTGGHLIALGPGNEAQVAKALATWPQGLQYGGGVNLHNAERFLQLGASHVIATSALFEGDQFSDKNLRALTRAVGVERLVIDLSCRRSQEGWLVATNRWQTTTRFAITAANLHDLAQHCAEFLIHAADVEGLQAGIDEQLVTFLGRHAPIPVTYAGGAKALTDLERVAELSQGRVDLTIGSALDIFAGKGVQLADCVAWNQQRVGARQP